MGGYNRCLYGGAISCRIPQQFEDLSNILPLPDHQEVFIYHPNYAGKGDCSSSPYAPDCVLSFELLDYVNDKDEESIARYLFDDLVACNEAARSSIRTWKLSELSNSLGVTNYKAIFVIGSMDIARGVGQYETKTRQISSFLYIVRLPTYRIDILITYNFPLDEESINYEKELCMFEEIVSTLEILDTNLFLHKPV